MSRASRTHECTVKCERTRAPYAIPATVARSDGKGGDGMSARVSSIAIELGIAAITLCACSSTHSDTKAAEPVPEAWSVTGAPLFAPELKPEDRAKKEAQLEEARQALAANPGGADEMIWVGRRLAYL